MMKKKRFYKHHVRCVVSLKLKKLLSETCLPSAEMRSILGCRMIHLNYLDEMSGYAGFDEVAEPNISVFGQDDWHYSDDFIKELKRCIIVEAMEIE